MKGIVFTTLLKMVEEAHGFDMVDTLIEKADLPSGGAYTAVGTYDHREAVSLVVVLSEETGVAVPDLLKAFGEYLFGVLVTGYPNVVQTVNDPLEFLEGVESYIHVQVRKLYPDAELPNFRSRRLSEVQLEMIYSSVRHFEDICEGLIIGAMKHFDRKASIEREALEDGREKFVITLES
ncbi:heme NO-binding domain-containing protein [Verrucomicrobiaceae bacterium 227]